MQFSTMRDNFERQLGKFIALCQKMPLNELTRDDKDFLEYFYRFEENDKWYIVLHDDLYTRMLYRIDPPITEDYIIYGNKVYEYSNHICSWVFFEERQ